MRVLIVNFGSRRNIGCYALLQGTLDIIRRAWPDTEVEILSAEEEGELLGCKITRTMLAASGGLAGKLQLIVDMWLLLIGAVCAGNSLLWKGYEKLLPRCAGFLSIYLQSDIVMNTGGDVLTEDYGRYSLSICTWHLLLGHLLRKKVILMGESLGPFNSFIVKVLMRWVLARAEFVFVRETTALGYANRELGLEGSRLHLIPDPSFAIQELRRCHGRRNNGGETSAICVAPSALSWRYTYKALDRQQESYNAYLGFLARLVGLLQSLADEVILIPHVRSGDSSFDDLETCKEIVKKVGTRQGLRIAEGVDEPCSVRREIMPCQLMVAFRMHACLAGVAVGVPTFSIGYSSKFSGMAMDIFDSPDWSADLRSQNLIEGEWVVDTLERAMECWNHREVERERIAAKLLEFDRKFETLVRLLQGMSNRDGGHGGA